MAQNMTFFYYPNYLIKWYENKCKLIYMAGLKQQSDLELH